MNKKALLIMIPAFLLFLGIGCGKQEFDKQRYTLNLQRPDSPSPIKTQALLEVQPFSIDAAFRSRGITYRKTEHEFETDYFREYLIPPVQMFTDQTRRWFDQSGMFVGVFSSSSLVRPTHILEGHIGKAYLDTSKNDNGIARLEISFFLLKNETGDPSLIFTKSYTAEKPTSSNKAELYFEALGDCLDDILNDFEKDLAGLFSK